MMQKGKRGMEVTFSVCLPVLLKDKPDVRHYRLRICKNGSTLVYFGDALYEGQILNLKE